MVCREIAGNTIVLNAEIVLDTEKAELEHESE